MRLSMFEAEQMPGLRPMLAQLATAIRDTKTRPILQLKGPCSLPAIPRGQARADRRDMAFLGTEKFSPSELVVETNDNGDRMTTVWLALVPTDMGTVQKVANVRLPLDKAMQTFEGLEDWVTSLVPQLKAPEPAGMPAGVAPITKEESRGSDAWGAW